jgi:hypothetical protein
MKERIQSRGLGGKERQGILTSILEGQGIQSSGLGGKEKGRESRAVD